MPETTETSTQGKFIPAKAFKVGTILEFEHPQDIFASSSLNMKDLDATMTLFRNCNGPFTVEKVTKKRVTFSMAHPSGTRHDLFYFSRPVSDFA
ncbi:MAG: hypothetical protein WC385_00615 [Candidatus Paceibacterota bacterium]|jgi:hypothetical protein